MKRKLSYKPGLIVLAIGVAIVFSAYIYDSVVDTIGVNFGAAFIWMFGWFVTIVSLALLVARAVQNQKDLVMKLAILLFSVSLAVFIFGLSTAEITNQEEVERLHGCNSVQERTRRPDKYCRNLKRAPEAEIDYLNSATIAGLAGYVLSLTLAATRHYGARQANK